MKSQMKFPHVKMFWVQNRQHDLSLLIFQPSVECIPSFNTLHCMTLM